MDARRLRDGDRHATMHRMHVAISLIAVLGAMLLVGFAFAGVAMPDIDGDPVVIAVATLFGALVGGLITFSVERWRIDVDRRERRKIAATVVGEALANFEIALADRARDLTAHVEDPHLYPDVPLRTPDFPLLGAYDWIARLDAPNARAVFDLFRQCRAHDLCVEEDEMLMRWHAKPIDTAEHAQRMASLWVAAAPIRQRLETEGTVATTLISSHQAKILEDVYHRRRPVPPTGL